MADVATDPMFAPLITAFVKNLPKRAADLLHAQAHANWTEVSSLAHQMAGAAAGYGFPELGVVAAQIEALAEKHPRPAELARSIRAFDSLCSRIVHAEGSLS